MLESLPSSSATDNLHALCLEAAFREWKRNSDSSFDFRIVSAILEPQFRREKKLLLLSTPFLVSILAKFIPTHFLSLFVKKKKKFEAKGRREKKRIIGSTRRDKWQIIILVEEERGERAGVVPSFCFENFPNDGCPSPPVKVRCRRTCVSRGINGFRGRGTKGGMEGRKEEGREGEKRE